MAGLETTSASAALTVTGVPAAGDYRVQLRYANGQAGSQPVQTRTATVTADDAAPVTATLPPTSGWDYWRTASVVVRLKSRNQHGDRGLPDRAELQRQPGHRGRHGE